MTRRLTSPSLAQTHMQGPLSVNGSGKSLTGEELAVVKKELERFQLEHNVTVPQRAHMDDPMTEWMFGGQPDYSLTDYLYLKGRTKQHAKGSIEETVENIIKTWEMERSHKPNATDHQTVDYTNFTFSANGGKVFRNIESHMVGNYNVMLNTCPKHLYNAAATSWEEAHDKFHTAFAAFPFEVLQVFSPPPRVSFTWRHWAHFTGQYDGHQGKGELVELFGFGLANLTGKGKIAELEVYFDPVEFLSVLKGLKSTSEINQHWQKKGGIGGGCPFHVGAATTVTATTKAEAGSADAASTATATATTKPAVASASVSINRTGSGTDSAGWTSI